jgi:hypothetical protein
VHTLVATIGNANTGTSTQFACESFDWNGDTLTSSGSYTQTFTNLSGCDSVHTLVATIDNVLISNSPVIACDSFIWNGVVYDSSGTYTYSGDQNNYALNFDGNSDYINCSDEQEFSIDPLANNDGWSLSFCLNLIQVLLLKIF